MQERFEIGGYWLDQVPGSPYWYRCWYEPLSRRVRRRSLRTTDFELAKEALAEWYTANKKPTGESPDKVYLAPVLESYLVGVTDKKPSRKEARRAVKMLLAHFGATALVSDLTTERQKDFMRKCAQEKEHSVAYISRNLSVLSAAIRHAELAYAPRILFSEETVAAILDKPVPGPRQWIPTIQQVGKMLDAIPNTKRGEALFRFFILELTTAARPEAVTDLGPDQVNARLIDLNPAGRKQTKKFRPNVVACDCLFQWLQTWDAQGDRFIYRYRKDGKGKRIRSMKNQVKRLGRRVGVPMYQYALRHFVATELKKRGVSREERRMFMGHKEPDNPMDDWYEKFDPSYLAGVVEAVDSLILDIQKHTRRPLFPQGTGVVALKLLSNGPK